MVWLNVAAALLAVTAVAQTVNDPPPAAIVPGAYIVEYEVDQVSMSVVW